MWAFGRGLEGPRGRREALPQTVAPKVETPTIVVLSGSPLSWPLALISFVVPENTPVHYPEVSPTVVLFFERRGPVLPNASAAVSSEAVCVIIVKWYAQRKRLMRLTRLGADL